MSPTYYSYYADDQVHTVQDGRGAVATYSYNARHLVTAISYSAPGGVTAAAAVSYAYDETGHRTQMTDGMGTATYHYDQLSRMDWEERTISALARSYRLSYTYNLGGELSSITDPFNSTISYGRDSAGRMTSITGPTYGGVSLYLSAMRYRAWGALKSLAYGNSRTLSVSYNQRMQATHLEVPGVESSDVLYQGDGRVSSASNLMAGEAKFSRSYGYDAVGRVTSSATPEDGPYNQTFSYDEWNNLTERVTYHWGHYLGESASYVNNKNPSWGYDGEGRLTTKGSQTFQFDSSGAMTQMYNPSQQFTTHSYGVTLSYGYDGDGRKLKQTKSSPNLYPSSTSVYYLHSSVLGGQVIAELRENGEKRFGYIYMGSEEVAREEISGGYGSLTLRHENMVTGSVRRTDTTGAVIPGESVELDAIGNSVGMSDPYPTQEQMDNSDRAYPRFGEPVNQFGGCSVDGVPAPCGYAMGLVNMGAGVQVFTREGMSRMRNGRTEVLTATTDYHYGFIPQGATSDGNGGYTFPRQGGPPVLRPSSIIPGLGGEDRNPYGVGMDEGAGSLSPILDVSLNLQQQRNHPAAPTRNPKAVYSEDNFRGCLRKMGIGLIRFDPNTRDGEYFMASADGQSIAIWSDVTKYDSAGLKTAWVPNVSGRILGVTPGGWRGLHYIASDYAAQAPIVSVAADRIHEIGNSIFNQTSLRLNIDRSLHPDVLAHDADSGMALEDCVFGGQIQPDGTVSIHPGR